jgi:iron complex outermembrane receptor protein
MPFPMNVNKDIPPMGMMMPPMPGMGMMMTNYRTQNSIPDTYTTNVGIYIENEKQINKNLTQKSGIRYDIHSTKAKKDRRIVYNIYYPFYDPIYQFKYVSQTEAFTIFDAEVYIPEKELKREYAEGSGYLKWDYKITSELTGKLGLGYGSRFPDPQELYFALFRMGTIQAPDAVGNPTLKPTRNKQLDLGMDLKQEKIRLEVDLFYSALDNYIVVRNSPDHLLGNITRDDLLYHWILQPAMMMMPSYNFYQYVNAIITNYAGILNPMMSMMMPYGRFGKTYKQVDAILYGGEISLKYQLSEEYLAKMGISYSRGINETEDTNLPEIPPLKGLLSIKYIKNQFYVELEGEFAATQNLVDKNIGEKRTPGWGIGNLYAGYELQKDEKQSTKIVAGIKNIFNRYYYEHLSYLRDPYATGMKIPEPGRNVFVQLTMKF